MYKRLIEKKSIWTTRVSEEQGKYSLGNFVKTNINSIMLIITDIKIINSITEHPFLKELSEKQKKEIACFDPPYDLIKLERVI